VSLSPSAKLVFRVLQNDHPLTSQEITERTLLPQRTTRYALGKLDNADLIKERIHPKEPRKHLYTPQLVAEIDD
jgi:DNA-binding MarR family transcriptional regulator